MATLSAAPSNEPISSASAKRIDMKLEVAVIPVADVDRAYIVARQDGRTPRKQPKRARSI
jgi:hypothetical protein